MRRMMVFCAVFAAALLWAVAEAGPPEVVEGGVRFTFRSPGAARVNLAGEFNGWSADAMPMQRGDGGAWNLVVPLAPGTYRYKFVVNGTDWKEDPDNPTKVDDNYGGFNSLLVVKPDGGLSFEEGAREIPVSDEYDTDRGTVFLNLVWHQHQPLYLDPEKDQLQGPWVRAHGTKDYYDMASILRRYPDVHYNVNLTSVLLFQLQTYYVERLRPFVDPVGNRVDEEGFFAAWKGRTDPWIDMALMDTEAFGETEDAHLFRNAWNSFGVSEVVINRFPQYLALREKEGKDYTVQEKRAIKTWHYLAWFDPDFLRGPVELPGGWVTDLSDLVAEDESGNFRLRRALSEEDANRLVAETWKVLASVVPIHEELMYDPAAGEGQIEVMTTPYYHPILPLIYDSDVARICQPNDRLPERFSYPADAEAQVAKAVVLFKELFGQPPRGMWPGEGSVSESIVPILARNGIRWMATADRVLGKSTPAGQSILYPYRVESREGPGKLAVVFRDTPLSDKIGFRYQRLYGEEAADDFIRDVLRAAPPVGEGDRLLTVILDGENAWEWYVRDNDAKEFLHALYRKLSKLYEERKVVTVTTSEYIEGNRKRGVPPHPIADMKGLERLWPGSWIDANFATWIGEREENLAWEILRRTREDLESTGIPAPDPRAAETAPTPGAMAWEEMYAAEGSDWFWWYGTDQNAPGGDEPFDRAFRTHIENVYRYAREAGASIEAPEIEPVIRSASTGGGGAMAQGGGKPLPVLFTCDATAQKVAKAIYIVGNQPELADWTPNKIPMYDDGTHGDEKAGDGIWSLLIEFPEGARIEYKYTNSGPEGSWSPSEEFPVSNRSVDVYLDKGATRVMTKDLFGQM
ncbi:MAG: hypothetical protein JW958_02485 [Candidatus Eisenbacteria bacterium]|nr:hypothetical protein [Candidatus Eisenbacteria bacterium]